MKVAVYARVDGHVRVHVSVYVCVGGHKHVCALPGVPSPLSSKGTHICLLAPRN